MQLYTIVILVSIFILNIIFIVLHMRKGGLASNQDYLREISANLAVANKEVEHLNLVKAEMEKELDVVKKKNISLELELKQLNHDNLEGRVSIERLAVENTNLKSAYVQLEEILFKLKQDINQEFNNLKAQAIIELKAEAAISLKTIGRSEVVEPLDKNLQQLQEKIIALTEQTKTINKNSEQLNIQAQNLANALTKDSQKKGAFGEMILANLLESVGLQDKICYLEQEQIKHEGELLIPDMILHLPENRGVIIDSKNIMQAYYNSMIAGEDDYANIKKAILRTIKDLALKKYVNAVESKLSRIVFDYIIMFIPNEGLFNFIINEETSIGCNLLNEAYQKKIILAGPSTLLALMAIIDKMWKTYEVEERAENIIKIAIELADKLRITIDNLAKLGLSLKSSVDGYNRVIASFDNNRSDCVINKVAALTGYTAFANLSSIDNIELRKPSSLSENIS